MVTTSLPAFAQPGQTIDVTVSSMGNAKSLRGGTLLMTPLQGADGQVYAMAQGNVLVGGAGASGGGASVQVNQLAVGRISAGATVERAVASNLGASPPPAAWSKRSTTSSAQASPPRWMAA
jgi:flagellar P-ring protein precursor FlgI